MKTLRLILGDQLNHKHTWFRERNPENTYVIMEVRQETDYVRHHIQKVLSFFSAMRCFAKHLRDNGHSVIYLQIRDKENRQSIPENLSVLIKKNGFQRFQYLLPDEYRLDRQLKEFTGSLKIPAESFDTEHFLTGRHDLREFFEKKNGYLMESFYRHMRKKLNILMSGNEPIGKRWNYDTENRKRYDKKVPIPEPLLFRNETRGIHDEIMASGIETIGTLEPERLIWPVNPEQSMALLNHFLENGLPYFGTYQDAMSRENWALYHSRLSFSLNVKMLHPLQVVNKAIYEWQKNRENISISQIEGFARQIIGWREYMRGVYWAQMPGYAKMNFFSHRRKLPHFYWTADTRMNCMHHTIKQSLEKAYAHHIQRLMVTGNFALLSGIDPDEVDAWYLGIYIDAIEWVEITNTRGMSQYADGGIVGTKPYVGSANYINKMSDYCNNCYYDKNKKHGEKSCPFNSLYWHFHDRHRDKLVKNPRIGMAYRVLDGMDSQERARILEQAESYLKNIENL